MKKKLKLKSWVKETLIAIAAIGVLVVLNAISNNQYEQGVINCVNAGYSQEYCEIELGK